MRKFMKRTPPEVSRKLQEIRQKSDVWKAAIARARAALAGGDLGAVQRIAYGEAQLEVCTQELQVVLRRAKKKFWKE